ncbi:MAG: hypothetical protein QOE72_4024 [Chloroflexota bacterium]|nr:hypothetical protein [Chloroflexota bacterium]
MLLPTPFGPPEPSRVRRRLRDMTVALPQGGARVHMGVAKVSS